MDRELALDALALGARLRRLLVLRPDVDTLNDDTLLAPEQLDDLTGGALVFARDHDDLVSAFHVHQMTS